MSKAILVGVFGYTTAFVGGILLAVLLGCSSPSKLDDNRAAEFAKRIPATITGECKPWGDDVLCQMTPTTLLWCTAPKSGKPHCEVAADWTPKAKEEAQPAK